MSKLQLSALARRVAATDPLDRDEQKAILDRLTEIRCSIDRTVNQDCCESLDGALQLISYVYQMGHIGGREVLDVTVRLLNNAQIVFQEQVPPAEPAPAAEPAFGDAAGSDAPTAGGAQALGSMLLGEVMLKRGMVEPAHIEEALRISQTTSMQFGEALVSIGAATLEQVHEALRYQDNCRRLVEGVADRRIGSGAARIQGARPSGKHLRLAAPMTDGFDRDADGLRMLTDAFLGSVMVQNGLVTRKQVNDALMNQRGTGLRLGESLVNLGFCTWTDVEYALQLQGRKRRNAG